MNPSTNPQTRTSDSSAPAIGGQRAWDEAIVRSLCYADIFGFPLKLDEIVRFAEETQITEEQAAGQLAGSEPLRQVVKQDKEFYYLEGRAGNCQRRRDRESESRRQLEIALRRLVPLQGIPFLRMAAVTGALAALNSPAGDDIDLLVITSRGRIWTTYLSLRLWRRFGHNPDICFNIFLSEGDLEFSPGLFFAREILGSLPILNSGVFEEFLDANPWVFEIFPSFTPDAERMSYKIDISPHWRRRQRQVERALTGPLGDLLEFVARKFQSRILINAAPDAAMGAHRTRIKLHKHDNRSPILDKYEQRCRQHLAAYRELAGPDIKPVEA